MDKQRLSKMISVIVMLVGIVVMMGWIFDIAILKSILPVWITMKFTTALSFLLSGITIYFIAKSQEARYSFASIVLPIITSVILLLMVTLLISTFLGIRLSIEDLFVRDVKGAVSGWFPGRPSVLTMIEFILIALAGILAMLNLRNLNLQLLCLGWMIMIIGGLAVAGYLFNVPFLRYDIKGWSNPMAIHTSILFTMIGFSLILVGGRKQVS